MVILLLCRDLSGAVMDEEPSSSVGEPSPPAPSLHDTRVAVSVQVVAADEKSDLSEDSPLIKGDKKSNRLCQCSSWNWKNLITTICLWLTYLFVSSAYSIIGPFFPSEV